MQIDCRASLRYNYYIEIEVEFHLHEWSLFAKSNLFNTYGVSAYDWTPAGDELIQRTDKEAKKELVNLVEADTECYDSWVSEENQYIYDGVTLTMDGIDVVKYELVMENGGGSVSPDEIAKMTGLSFEEIEEILSIMR